MRDVPVLMREVSKDVLEDSEAEIKEWLFKHFWSKLGRGVTRGLPEFYKEYLAWQSFEK